jgi:pullulanase/glycogen debranching enzyme
MAKRLIIDSCSHLIEAYGVDGFRFDLAELIGVEVMKEVEAALKRVKPSVILIAEPWSFRGHIAGALRDTGWASWNDGFRNFVKEYVHGGAPAERLEYFLRGSPWYFAKWPAQTTPSRTTTGRGSTPSPRTQASTGAARLRTTCAART